MLYITAILVAVCSYLVGSINTSIILSKAIYGTDIRKSGSGNAGATNMLRTHGTKMAVATLLFDVLKGVLMVALVSILDKFSVNIYENAPASDFERTYLLGSLKYIAGIFVVLGHDFPLYFGFKGGKGVATSLGVMLTLNWKVGLIILALALTIMAITRYVSLGSITAAAVYPFVLFTFMIAGGDELSQCITYLFMAVTLAVILIAKHHSNITKLKNGTENKLFAKKEKTSETKEDSK
ncbi:MAG: glycerol-3-phosphate 1-O-acyltransferase PlsY [Ruminococcaceae bacterium]|nr:glycerol-3-phosphate 1-O-acyltransferase PlsY [Oscillospiraceae bacterium]